MQLVGHLSLLASDGRELVGATLAGGQREREVGDLGAKLADGGIRGWRLRRDSAGLLGGVGWLLGDSAGLLSGVGWLLFGRVVWLFGGFGGLVGGVVWHRANCKAGLVDVDLLDGLLGRRRLVLRDLTGERSDRVLRIARSVRFAPGIRSGLDVPGRRIGRLGHVQTLIRNADRDNRQHAERAPTPC
jgi:hypothetical protein